MLIAAFRLMWKICQEASPKTEVMTPHSTRLPPLYPQRYLAGFRGGLGILIIGGTDFFPASLRVESGSAGFAPAGLFYWARQNFSVAHEVTQHPPGGTEEGTP